MTSSFAQDRRQCIQRLGVGALSAITPGIPSFAASTSGPPALMLASDYQPSYVLSDVLVSEKYDGVRGYWDGQRLWTRGGNPIAAPDWFTEGWPAQSLDGELWAGRGQFAHAVSTVHQQRADDAAWRQMQYMVFDLPAHSGPFRTRHVDAQNLVRALQQPWVQAVLQTPVPDAAALRAWLDRTVSAGGEGLMLHRNSALYLPGRSAELVKFKPFQDAEAQVVGHLPGQGRFQGLTGALLVDWPGLDDGKAQRFKLGSGLSDAERHAPPALGSWVTFRFRGRTAQGVPRFATYLRPASEPGL